MPIQKFQWFFKWIAQDDYQTKSNQVLYSSWLDLNKETYSVELDAWYTSLVTTWDKNILCWFYVEDTWWNRTAVWAWDSWVVYKSDWTDDTPDFTFSDWRAVVNATNMWWFVYFIRPSWTWQIRVGKMDQTNTSISSVTETITPSAWTFPDWTLRSKYPVYNFNDQVLIIWVWGKLITLDINDAVTTYDLFADSIVWIEKIGSQFKVYSSDWTVAFWTFEAWWVNESYKIDDFIRWSKNKWQTDFMVSWFNSTQTNLHITSGYSAPIIWFQYDSPRLTIPKFKTRMDRPTQLWRIWDNIYFINENGTYDALWSFWNKVRWLWDAFQEVFPINPISSSIITSLYGFQWPWLDTLFIWVAIDWIEQIVKYEIWGTKQTSWYMILPIVDWWDRLIKKKLKRIYITTSWTDENNTVKLSASYDQWAYEDIRTIDQEWDSLRTIISEHTKEWTDVNFRIDFTRVSWNPKFHWLKIVYEIIKD